MKESPRRYINPFLSDEENDKANFSNNDKVNYVTNLEDGNFRKSLAPSNVPSESVEEAKELCVDKNVTDCELPELITYYEERSFHVVKDICVDEGLYDGEKNASDKEHHKLSSNPTTVNGDKHDDKLKVDLDTQFLKHDQLKSSPLEDCDKNASLVSVTEDDNVPSNFASDELRLFIESDNVQSKVKFDPDNTMQNGEGKLDSNFNYSTEQIVSGSVLSLNQNQLGTSVEVLKPSKNGVNDVEQQLSEAKSAGSEADKSNEIKIEENIASNFDNVKPATVTVPHEPPVDTQNTPNHHEMAPDSIIVSANQLQGGDGESSISMAVPVSGLITYSGPVASAGSISHRSDGSNTSVRSFAFPILQNEWNSSPIRMAKADQRRSRKHQGWRQALMCCRF